MSEGAANNGGKSGLQPAQPTALTVITAIVILLLYQGYTLSVPGIAAPWIAKSFHLDEQQLARLFAWMSGAAVGSLFLARAADRYGRRLIIITSLIGASLCSFGAALATYPPLFALMEIVVSALLGGSVSSAIALLAEELAVDQRARGQAAAALAGAVGGVVGYVIMPLLAGANYSWRWLFALSGCGLTLVVPMARMLPGGGEWQRAAATGSVSQSHIYDIFARLYRRATLTLIACAALDTIAGTAVNGWLYFETVTVFGLSPTRASTLVVVGTGIGMLGFPLGAWSAEKFGRVPTVTYLGGAAWLGAVAFYWGTGGAITSSWIWLIVAYSWFKIGASAMTVGANAAATELFPAALRTTIIGWQMITSSVFTILAQIGIAALIEPLGGLTFVIRYCALLGIPSALLFRAFIDETRGMSLGDSAKEGAWTENRRTAATQPLHGAEQRAPDGHHRQA